MNCQVSCSFHLNDPKLEDVQHVLVRMISFLGDQGIRNQKFLDEFQLAAAEALNNAIEHGCSGYQGGFVEAELVLRTDSISLEISDPSDFEGWSGSAELPEDPLMEGGRGHFLMEQMSDGITHSRRDGRHQIVLRKNLNGTHWQFEPGTQERVLNSMIEELGASYEMINALIGLGELLAAAENMSSFLDLALKRLCELTGADIAFVRMRRPNGLVLVRQAVSRELEIPAVISFQSKCVESLVFATGEEATITRNEVVDGEDPLHGLIDKAFVAPILFKSDRCGVLVIAHQEATGSYFSAAQLQVARVVGDYLGIVSEINELHIRRETEQRGLRELEIAGEIQMSLMPQKFNISENLDIFGTCLPALKAGGDYFDIISLPQGGTFVVIADVMGKGVSAALFANMLRTNIRANLDLADDPGRLLTIVNSLMFPDLAKRDVFITVACAWIASDVSRVLATNAGHPSSLLMQRGETLSVLPSQGFPVGIVESTVYESQTIPFDRGDALLIFTDGILETFDSNDCQFDKEALQEAISCSPITSAEEIVHRVLVSVDNFSDHAPPYDDRTLIAIIRKS